MQNLDVALDDGREDLLYYNSLLADLELGDSIWSWGKLPNPAKSLIVIPRYGIEGGLRAYTKLQRDSRRDMED